MNNSVNGSNPVKKESSVVDWLLNIAFIAILATCLYLFLNPLENQPTPQKTEKDVSEVNK